MADDYLKTAKAGESDFYNAFIGSPYNSSSWGCYPPVIKYAANTYLLEQGGEYFAYNITGASFDSLLELVAGEKPVLCWVSMGLKKLTLRTDLWEYDGNSVSWLSGEHCMVLTGYNLDKNEVYVMDPLKGKKTYALDLFRQRYEDHYSMSIVIN
jgi:uncharacterized protein YvpB